jgi:hypothetical protein
MCLHRHELSTMNASLWSSNTISVEESLGAQPRVWDSCRILGEDAEFFTVAKEELPGENSTAGPPTN